MYPGLGIAPVLVTYAVNALVPAIESLFKSSSAYSFPAAKQGLDTWAGVVNLDPTLVTLEAQWAWANLRCVAGDQSAASDWQHALDQFPLTTVGGVPFRLTPDGPVNSAPPCSGGVHLDAAAYALAIIRVLTTVRASAPATGNSLYSGTMPTPLPQIATTPASGTIGGTIGGVPVLYLGLGALAFVALSGRR